MFALLHYPLLALLSWASVSAQTQTEPGRVVWGSGNSGLSYVKSEQFGDFLLVKNRTIKHGLVYESKAAESMCECRTMCWTSSRCHSATLKEAATRSSCDLSEMGPENATMEAKGAASSMFWLEPLNLTYLEVLPRGIYWVHAHKKNFTTARTICSSVHGHRLMIIKEGREQELVSRAAMAMKAPILLHLMNSQNGLVWGDGTRYMDTVMARSIQPTVLSVDIPAYKFVLDKTSPALVQTDFVTEDFFMCQGDLDN
ncbi:uncharacterized protein LOC119590989 [Penaeus monodon]|uniref:uncharacterized protein LOC119590989 n=1 Tax=Penaeus monodon TaxID=6687 RepID=UPI0018A7CED9|nr:uncharacterized protein LOC119590989 [Penaeus monodon]